MRLWAYPLVVFALSFFDLVNTAIGIHLGVIVEANPIAQQVIKFGGLPLLITWKIFVTLLAILLVEYSWRKNLISKRSAEIFYLCMVIGYVVGYTVGILVINWEVL